MLKCKYWSIYKFIVIIAMLQSFGAWFLVFMPSSISSFILLLATLYCTKKYTNYFTNKKRLFNPLLYALSIIFATNINVGSIVYSIFSILLIVIISSFAATIQKDIMNTILNVIACILFISMIWWLMFLLGIDLPHTLITIGHYEFDNYYLCMDNQMYLLNRFSSVFLEPGYLGCLCALFLFLDDYKISRRNIIFYLSLILTISLAGYILTFLGFCLKSFRFNKKFVSYILILSFLVIGVWHFAKTYNGGDNWLNNGIFLRLMFDSSTGTIVGDNRSTNYFDYWFWNNFTNSSDLLLGTGSIFEDEDVADWKVYIVLHGLISFVFYVLYLLSPLFYRNNRRDVFIYIILNLLIFYQTCYGMHWYMYVFTFILGLGYINDKEKTRI